MSHYEGWGSRCGLTKLRKPDLTITFSGGCSIPIQGQALLLAEGFGDVVIDSVNLPEVYDGEHEEEIVFLRYEETKPETAVDDDSVQAVYGAPFKRLLQEMKEPR